MPEPAGRTGDGRPWRVRPTRAEDVPALVALVDAVAAEGRWLLVRPGQRTAVEEHLLLAQLGQSGGLSLTLEVASAVAGRVVVIREPAVDRRAGGELAILLGAASRGHGLGRLLLGHALEWSRRAGLELLRLRVLPDNLPAISLYRSCGFIDAGLAEHPDALRSGHLTLLTMTLELGGEGGDALLSSTADE